MNAMFLGYGAIILAGGHGRRLGGVDKARLKIGEKAIIEGQLELLCRKFEEVIISSGASGRYVYPGVQEVVDEQAGCGPVMGLYCGLKASEMERNFVTGCDMPYLCEQVVELLVEESQGEEEAVVAIVNGERQPLTAVYHRRALDKIGKYLGRGEYKFMSLLSELNVKEIDEERIRSVDGELRCFININTEADLDSAEGKI